MKERSKVIISRVHFIDRLTKLGYTVEQAIAAYVGAVRYNLNLGADVTEAPAEGRNPWLVRTQKT